MITSVIKLIHLMCVLGLLGSTFYSLILLSSKKLVLAEVPKQAEFNMLSRIILYLALIALLTGTLLVYPRHYTFHTHWIQAAYLLLIVFATGITVMKKRINKSMGQANSFINKTIWRIGFLLLITILIFIVHDAVTKSTFLFPL